MSLAQAATVTARLDRLPSSPYLWRLLVLLSLGGFFEVYDLFLTAYVTPGLIRDNIFLESNKGLFGLTDQATFAAAMFAGLFVGTILFGWVADKYGRRNIFTFALLWYAAATAIMAFQSTRLGVNLWRFVNRCRGGRRIHHHRRLCERTYAEGAARPGLRRQSGDRVPCSARRDVPRLATRAAPSIWHLGLAHCGAGAGDRRASRLVDPPRSTRIAALARPAWQGGRSRKGDGRDRNAHRC